MNPFWRKEVLESRIVSDFLLFAICGHLPALEMYLLFYFSRFTVTSWRRICICFSPFSDLQSLWKPGSVSFFLFLAICGHFRIHECICILLFLQSAVTFGTWDCILFSPFSNLQSHFNPGNVSAFLLFAICGHLPAPESDVQSLVSNKKTQQKTIFSPDAAGFLDSKKDSGISCLFWRRYFFLWGVAKTI